MRPTYRSTGAKFETLEDVLDALEVLICTHAGMEHLFDIPEVRAFFRDPAVERIVMRPSWAEMEHKGGGHADGNSEG